MFIQNIHKPNLFFPFNYIFYIIKARSPTYFILSTFYLLVAISKARFILFNYMARSNLKITYINLKLLKILVY